MFKLPTISLLLVSWSCLVALSQAKTYSLPDLTTDYNNAIPVDEEEAQDPFASW